MRVHPPFYFQTFGKNSQTGITAIHVVMMYLKGIGQGLAHVLVRDMFGTQLRTIHAAVQLKTPIKLNFLLTTTRILFNLL